MTKRGLGIALMLLPLGLAAQQTAGGQSESFALLNKAAGARALALGGAYEALAEGAEGMLWNPAAPALSKGLEAGLNHENLVVSTSREVLSLQAPVLSWLSLGGFGAMVSYPGVELRDNSGAYQGTYSPREQGFGLVLAAHYQGLALGLSGRYLSQDLPGYSSSSTAGEAGLLWDAMSSLRLGVAVRALPQANGSLQPRGAGGFTVHGSSQAWSWNAASSVRLDPAGPAELDLGLEGGWNAGAAVALRAGYSQDFPALSESLGRRYSLGMGVGFQYYQVDYAFLPWGDFGATHRLSFSFHQDWSKNDKPLASSSEQVDPSAAAAPAALAPAAAVAAPQGAMSPEAAAMAAAVDASMAAAQNAQAPAPAATSPLSASSGQASIGLPGTQFRVLSEGVAQARALEAAGNGPGALKAYHAAATSDPADGEAWRGMGRLYTRMGRSDYAKRCWSQVLKLAPQDAEALAGMQGP